MSEMHLSQELLTVEEMEKSGFFFLGNHHEMRIARWFCKKGEPALPHFLHG